MNGQVTQSKVLVVDDEPNIADLIAMALRFHEFEATTASGGPDALRKVEEFRPDLVILDVMMPGIDGFEVAARLRDRGHEIPIIFLTAKDSTEDKIRGLSIGGDDYVTKPFSIEELLARVRVVLKRSGVGSKTDPVLKFVDLELNSETREAFRNDHLIELTDTEFRLLRFFMSNPRRVLTRDQILDHVWNYDFAGDARVLETYVSYLRKKLVRFGTDPIVTVRGVGYALREPKE